MLRFFKSFLFIALFPFLLSTVTTSAVYSYIYINKLSYKELEVFKPRSDFDDLTVEQQQLYINAEKKLSKHNISNEDYDRYMHIRSEMIDIMNKKEEEIIEKSLLGEDKIRQIVSRYSTYINQEPIHKLFDECGCIWLESGAMNFILRTNNRHPDYYYPVVFERDWMGCFSCKNYALHILRREDPYSFVSPHGAKCPISVLVAQGYEPVEVSEVGENDLCFYFRYIEDPKIKGITDDDYDFKNLPKELVRSSHYGVYKNGRVISKQMFAGIASHTPEAGGFHGWRYMFFRKNFDLSAKTPIVDDIDDWVQCGDCVTRKSGAFEYKSFPMDMKIFGILCHTFYLVLFLSIIAIWNIRRQRLYMS